MATGPSGVRDAGRPARRVGDGRICRGRLEAGRAVPWFHQQVDQLAVPGQAAGVAVLPTGDLFTGFTELHVRVGPRRSSFAGAHRRLEAGWRPLVIAERTIGTVVYESRAFAGEVAGTPIAFTQIRATNRGRAAADASVQVDLRDDGATSRTPGGFGRYRFLRPVATETPGLYAQPGWAFDASAQYAFAGRAVVRDGRTLLIGPAATPGVRASQLLRPSDPAGAVTPATTFGRTTQRTRLAPGRSVSLTWALPIEPVEAGGPVDIEIAGTGWEDARQSFVAAWDRQLRGAMRIEVPERKVADAYRANIVSLLAPRTQLPDGRWVQAVNALTYHAFWLRDVAVIAAALDRVGLHEPAGQDLEFVRDWQRGDGLFISRPEQYDGFGQTLWALGDHALRTGDVAFARRALPSVRRALAWFATQRASDPLGLVPPVARAYDNDLVTGHVVGDSFWAVAGVQGAAWLARVAGETDDETAWTALRDTFAAHVRAQVEVAAARTSGGAIPPALDHSGGQDWGNLWAAYPYPVLPPSSPAVTATLRRVDARGREGIATYRPGRRRVLHGYVGFRSLETRLLRGEQRAVVAGMYAELAHTSGTHQGFEMAGIGSHAVSDGTAPHGWFSAELVTLVRNMLVRETDGGIDLLSAVPAAWLAPGRTVRVTDAPTTAGPVSFTVRGTSAGATLRWNADVPIGTTVRWPVPASARDVRVKGRPARGAIVLHPGSGTMRVTWSLRPDGLTFAAAARRAGG